KIYKCDLCYNRLRGDESPSCVKSCPTGALTIGRKEVMTKKAYARVKELGGDANVYGDKFVGGTHVLYVLDEKAKVYDNLPRDPSVPLSLIVWKDMLKPLSLLAAGGVLAGSFLHYILHGPKLPDEPGPNEPGKDEKGGE
ncbi:MAG: formate dehydrogenase N subunit beta transmembrane domain-containing protein, partial [Syntrophus sp. (in: bacteria)]